MKNNYEHSAPGSPGELAAVRAGLHGGLPRLRQARHQHLHLPPHRCTVCWSCAARCQCHGRERSVVPALAGRRSWSRSTLPLCRTSCTARPACCRRTPSPRRWPTSGAAPGRGAHQPGIRRLPVPRRLHPRPPGHGGEAEGGGRGGGHQAVGHRQAYTETYRKIRARADQV